MGSKFREILLKAKSGDMKSTEYILEKYNPLIIKRAMSYFIKGYETEDLIQIARVTALNSIDKYNFESKSSFTAYLDGAIRNNFNNMLRNTMRKSYESSLDAPVADGMFASDFIYDDNLTEEIVEKEFMLKELLTALEELSAYDRELILFLYSKSSGMLTRWSNLKGESYSKVRRRREEILEILRGKFDIK